MKSFIVIVLVLITFTAANHHEGDYSRENTYATGTTTPESIDSIPRSTTEENSVSIDVFGDSEINEVVKEVTPVEHTKVPPFSSKPGYVHHNHAAKPLFPAEEKINSLVFLADVSENAGLEEHLKSLDRKTLEAYSLAAEQFKKEQVGGNASGSIKDQIDNTVSQKLYHYIMIVNKQYPVLTVEKLQEKATEYGMTSTNSLETELKGLDRDTLEKYALTAEKYQRVKTGTESFKGGLHDYYKTVSDEKLIDYVVKVNSEYSELTLDLLKTKADEYGIMKDNTPQSSLLKLDRKTLEAYAYAAEKYGRVKKGKGNLLGGLHDYITSLTDEKVADYIVKVTQEYPELNIDKLEELSDKNSIKGFSDFEVELRKLERNTLEIYALTAEKYKRIHKGQLMGGIHDYYKTASDEVLIDYILSIKFDFSDLTLEELKSLSVEYGLDKTDEEHIEQPKENIQEQEVPKEEPKEEKKSKVPDDFRNKLSSDRGMIEKYTIIANEYQMLQTGRMCSKGYDEWVKRATDDELFEVIFSTSEKYPDFLNKVESLIELKDKTGTIKTIADDLKFVDRETLETYALTGEKYKRIQKNEEGVLGGLHDSIDYETNEYLIEYIVEVNKEYPELDLFELGLKAAEYGIDRKSHLEEELWKLDRSILETYALTAEKFNRTMNHHEGMFLGGHDTIDTDSDEKLIHFILDVDSHFPQLKIQKLKELAESYGIKREAKHVDVARPDFGEEKNGEVKEENKRFEHDHITHQDKEDELEEEEVKKWRDNIKQHRVENEDENEGKWTINEEFYYEWLKEHMKEHEKEEKRSVDNDDEGERSIKDRESRDEWLEEHMKEHEKDDKKWIDNDIERERSTRDEEKEVRDKKKWTKWTEEEEIGHEDHGHEDHGHEDHGYEGRLERTEAKDDSDEEEWLNKRKRLSEDREVREKQNEFEWNLSDNGLKHKKESPWVEENEDDLWFLL
jgi:hypothetical protein